MLATERRHGLSTDQPLMDQIRPVLLSGWRENGQTQRWTTGGN
ncbi:hypothetical Protein YC6258_05825 [Gynuella sunshinyii YC6258]|uniref:Uncharacterized protein n=1 Tax=Gynuella sunshinyii YC6258 TaxID=1445510 RepID=A0A0C5VX16_9GAMM|nr:hypothetical Protein YC6258_05825 [Gynuella sunshinyii YC6258]